MLQWLVLAYKASSIPSWQEFKRSAICLKIRLHCNIPIRSSFERSALLIRYKSFYIPPWFNLKTSNRTKTRIKFSIVQWNDAMIGLQFTYFTVHSIPFPFFIPSRRMHIMFHQIDKLVVGAMTMDDIHLSFIPFFPLRIWFQIAAMWKNNFAVFSHRPSLMKLSLTEIKYKLVCTGWTLEAMSQK